jgi:hypothetical protein
VSLGKLKEIQNGGKRARRGVDQWDRVGFTPLGLLSSFIDEHTAKYDRLTMTSCHTDALQ